MMNHRTQLVSVGAGLLLAMGVALGVLVGATDSLAASPQQATKEAPWENSLGMKFVPVKGTPVLFCIWHTRVQDFTAFVAATKGSAAAATLAAAKELGKDWQSPGFKQEPTHPVCDVSWEEAHAFCQWLTKKERAEGRLAANLQYRLPTDAEWSVAVGLGPETGATPHEKDSKIKVYPWGVQLPPSKGAGNYYGEENRKSKYDSHLIVGYDDGFKVTSPVGSFPANAFGLYDMGGNMWQWCEDLLDPPLPARVLRGGAWCTNDPTLMFSTSRAAAPPDSHYNFNGFRCVLAP